MGGECSATCLTLAGFGSLKPTRSDPFMPRVRDEIIAYAREQHLDHPVIVGHSMGGVMALWIAETAPELPGRLVIVDALPNMAAIRYPDVPAENVREKIAEDVRRSKGAPRRNWLRASGKCCPPGFRRPKQPPNSPPNRSIPIL